MIQALTLKWEVTKIQSTFFSISDHQSPPIIPDQEDQILNNPFPEVQAETTDSLWSNFLASYSFLFSLDLH